MGKVWKPFLLWNETPVTAPLSLWLSGCALAAPWKPPTAPLPNWEDTTLWVGQQRDVKISWQELNRNLLTFNAEKPRLLKYLKVQFITWKTNEGCREMLVFWDLHYQDFIYHSLLHYALIHKNTSHLLKIYYTPSTMWWILYTWCHFISTVTLRGRLCSSFLLLLLLFLFFF